MCNALMASIAKTITLAVTKTSTSKQAWDALHHLYTNKTHTHIFNLHKSLTTITENYHGMNTYLPNIRNVAQELETAKATMQMMNFL